MISLDDRSAITELIALHGHLVDDGRLEELNLMFADDVTHDLTAFGLGVHHGLSGVRESALALGDANPVGHHVTNIVNAEVKDDYTVVTRSRRGELCRRWQSCRGCRIGVKLNTHLAGLGRSELSTLFRRSTFLSARARLTDHSAHYQS
jgi:hypothetical protein